MKLNNKYFEKYVKLLVRSGVNIQRGQNLIITSPVECAFFVRAAAEEAYKAGAREVYLRWVDDKLARSRYLYAEDDSIFDEFPEWNKLMLNGLTEGGAAILNVSSFDPEAMLGVDIGKITRSQKASSEALKGYRERLMSSYVQWCVASVPNAAWASKVFPGCTDGDEAMERLWNAIFKASRVDDGDSVENWRQHVAVMKENTAKLNEYAFKSLYFSNSAGTDLTIELPPNHIWGGAEEIAKNGVPFLPNIPTEEIFTAPKRTGVNGRVVGTKPLVFSGNIAKNFSFVFKDGKVSEFTAENSDGSRDERGYELLRKLTSSLANMDFLGEVALVPHESPISLMDTLFYNTLYDENASCHLALGEAYPDCVKGGAEMDEEEKLHAGLNVSGGHHDFMVGSADMDIKGMTRDGILIDVFKDGNFALPER